MSMCAAKVALSKIDDHQGGRPCWGEPPTTHQLALAIPNGTIEAMKWIALACMVGDHVNAFLLDGNVPTLFYLGRLAFPLFAFVLTYNLARQGEDIQRRAARVAMRLLVLACLAQPLHAALRGGFPLNILFTLSSIAMVVALSQGDLLQRGAGLLVCGLFSGYVDFGAAGLTMGLAGWLLVNRPSQAHSLLLTGASAALFTVNGNMAAVPALLLVILATHVSVPLRRMARFFYLFYPMHLAAILILRSFTTR